jgi:hypothetical protein
MRGLIRHTAVVAGAAVALLGPAAGVASAGAGPVLGWSPTTSQGTYNYGTLQAGQTVSKAFVLTNSGGSATAALKITLAGSGAFTKTAETCTGTSLGPRKSCSVTVQYAPTTPGQRDAATLTAASGKTLASLTLLGAAAKASPAITTSPSPGGTVGAAVKDTAALSGGHSPTGTITFNLYGPSATANCSTTAVDTEKVTVTGDGNYTSPSFTPAQAGTYWWTASYGGDAANNPAATNCGDEQVAISQAAPAITTTPSPGGTVGAAVKDTATLSDGHSPTGTITFNLYGPSATANCSTTAVDTEKVTVTGDGSYTSPSFTPAQAGTYWWTASYGGDANNNPAATNCGDEQVAISQAAPAITTSPSPGATVGAAVTDTATLSGGDNPAGTITFNLYGPSGTASCTSTPVFTDTETVSSGTATSASFTPSQAGTYYWTASYNGDANNTAVVSGCDAEPVTISQASPAIATTPSASGTGIAGGTAVKDTATLSDGDNPTGTITFNLYGPSATANCSTTPVFTDTETVSGGTATSTSFTPAQAGTYWWTASYGGDANNNPAATKCGDESVTISQVTPAITTTPSPGVPVGTAVTDSAALSGGDNPTGQVTFDLYGPSSTASCTGTPVFTDTQTVTGGSATSASFTPSQAGTYWWTASYNGDANNATTATNCGDEQVTIGPHIYWAAAGTIMEANLDGTGVTTLVTGQNEPDGVAVDSSHIYWADLGSHTIMEANLDGTGVTTLVTLVSSTNFSQPHGVAVDSSHLYWTDVGFGTISEANLDGTGVTTPVTGQDIGPFGLAVDSSHLYWTNEADTNNDPNTGTIMKANLDGTGVTTLVTGQNEPDGVAVDSSHVYWPNIGSGTINEANLDGTGVTTLVTGQNGPGGVAVYGSHLFWDTSTDANFDPNTGTIMEANLDGTGVTTLVTGQNEPAGVAVGP